jgi:pyrroline-5-carboxylate reductase
MVDALRNKPIISIVGGVSESQITRIIPDFHCRLIRVRLGPAASVLESVTASSIPRQELASNFKARVDAIFITIGGVLWVEPDSLALIVEAMAQAAVSKGITRKDMR